MKSTAFLAKFYCILFVKIIYGQQNGFVNNQNVETKNILTQHQPTNAIVNTLQRLLNQNGNAGSLPNNLDHQVLIQTNKSPSFLNTINTANKIQQPPDAQQEPVSLQKLLQQNSQVPQSSQFFQQLSQQLIPTQNPAEKELFPPQQIIQSQQPLQQITQTFGIQENSRIPVPGLQQNVDIPQASIFQQNNYQPSSNQKLRLETTNPQALVNGGQSLSAQIFNVQPQNSVIPPVEIITNTQPLDFKAPDAPSVTYYISSQQSPRATNLNSVSSQNPSIALIPSYNVGSTKQAYSPSYNYANPATEVHAAAVDRNKAINSVATLPAVLTIPSQPAQNAQTYVYRPSSGSRQNIYLNQNTQSVYSQQPKIQLTAVQSQPVSAVIPNQSPALPSVPLSIIQAPSTISQYGQYGISGSYPVNTVIAPAYPTQKSKNLKSFLPLIFNLLKEKIACKNNCQSDCPCDCSKTSKSHELEVSSGYSNLKNYGALTEDGLSVLGTVSGETEGLECLRKRKNLKTEKETTEVSEETQEDDDSDEEGDDDEEED